MDFSELGKMGRRRFMENLTELGVSAATIQNITQEDLKSITDKPKEEIPYIARWENKGRSEDGTVLREPVYDTIPREKYERKEATNEALEEVGSLLESNEEADTFSLVLTEAEHSPTGYGVEVRTSPESREFLENQLPYNIASSENLAGTKIPIDIIAGEFKKQADSYEGELWNNIGGAAPIVKIGANAGAGTVTGTFLSNEYGKGWVTAGHVAVGNDEQLLQEIDDPIDTDNLGFSRDYTEYSVDGNGATGLSEVDCAFIESTAGKIPQEWLANEDYTEPTEILVTSIETDASLENHIGDNNWPIYVQGRQTGRTSSYIDGVVKDTNGNTKALSLDQDSTETGDSGGPIFRLYEEDQATICGSHTGIYESDDWIGNDSLGTTAQTIEEELDGQFLR